MNITMDLETAIQSLYTSEGRAFVTQKAVERGLNVPTALITQAIQAYEQAQRYGDAAQLYVASLNKQSAQKLEERIDAHKHEGKEHFPRNLAEALPELAATETRAYVMKLLKRHNPYQKMDINPELLFEAGEFFRHTNRTEDALELYEALDMVEGELAYKLFRQLTVAAQEYEAAGRLADALRVAKKIVKVDTDNNLTGDLYWVEKVIEYAERLGRLEEAFEYGGEYLPEEERVKGYGEMLDLMREGGEREMRMRGKEE